MTEPHPLMLSSRLKPFVLSLALPFLLLACGQSEPSSEPPQQAPPPQEGPSDPGNPSDPGAPGGLVPDPVTNPPSGGVFEDQTVVDNVWAPTDLAFTPDGRMLVTSQTGKLRVYRDGALQGVALDLGGVQCTNYEWGLLGVAVDPQFASNQHIYTYYTARKDSPCEQNNSNWPVNRVSRFTLNGDDIDPASEKVLLDNIPAYGGNHNGGDLAFGPDGKLYVSVGDAFCVLGDSSRCGPQNVNSRSKANLLGKILRINRDGSVPADNPFVNQAGARNCGDPGGVPGGSGPCAETYAWGLRNPFRMAFKPGTGELFINDVGQEHWDEINLGRAGADYGWNEREGFCERGSTTDCSNTPAGMTDPIFAYNREQADFLGCKSITGGTFVPPGVWPREYDGTYLFADYVCGAIFHLEPDGSGGYQASRFKSGLGESSAVTMKFGPYNKTQALYYLTYAGGGEVRRISYKVTNQAPTPVATASVTAGPLPLEVTFDAGGSTDPEGDDLRFRWDFGDGSSATGARATHTYTQAGTFQARVTVSDAKGAQAQASIRVHPGSHAPQPQILRPGIDDTFRVGESITLSGSATDAEDGPLPDSSLRWTVELRHNDDHSHPILPPTSGNGHTVTFPAPEGLQATRLSHLLVTLTATDSSGLSTTIRRELQPKRVEVSFATQPAGLRVSVNGQENVTAPVTYTSWVGYDLNIGAPAEQQLNGRTYVFRGWSHGGAREQRIVTPAGGGAYTAVYEAR